MRGIDTEGVLWRQVSVNISQLSRTYPTSTSELAIWHRLIWGHSLPESSPKATTATISNTSCSRKRPTSFSSVASRLFLSWAWHRGHPDLLLGRIRCPIIREILANAPAVGSKPIDNWLVGRQRQHYIEHIVAERASIEAGHLKCGGRSKLVRQRVGTKPCSDLLPVFTRVRRRTGISRHLLRNIRDRLGEALGIFRRNRRIELFFHLLIARVVQEEMRNHRQAPTRNLYLRRMAKEGDRRPCVDFSLPNQFARNFQHNRRNIPPRKGILLMQKGVSIEALFLIESSHKCAESSICRK